MESKTLRARAVRQALAHPASSSPTCRELQLLTQYVLGQRSREELNDELLRGNRLHLLAIS
ncbi:hypothetical protein GKZ68_12345 [Hymenobacter sp. BRD128]|uniref:hypothetical protein n=1 Tax=Hymenobacter sp. BRD128 TaxID=2675878 RepID=UPI0015675CFB|nr:hypothetical protein [Hymenobacter sp. BRD128]QKG57338.1 hypothetical protein GKZ68_12345 [Hymenobacter sp. BRD128]